VLDSRLEASHQELESQPRSVWALMIFCPISSEGSPWVSWKPIRDTAKSMGYASWFEMRMKEFRDNGLPAADEIRKRHKQDFIRIEEINEDIRKELQREQPYAYKI